MQDCLKYKHIFLLNSCRYGYNYTCESMEGSFCNIKQIPFRGVNCSDAAGYEVGYAQIMATVDSGSVNVMIDPYLQNPFFNLQSTHQIWYDDVSVLKSKYDYAKSVGLLGVGPFGFDYLDADGSQTHNPKAPQEAKAMWQALKDYLQE